MDKITDRILWSVLVLAIGVSLFVFGKPALVNLTNQVLHRDDLKSTMQTPSLTSLDVSNISAVNNDVGVSKHAYILASTKGIVDDNVWGGERTVSMPNEVIHVPIPYNSYAKFLFKIKVNEPLIMRFDVNNRTSTGASWGTDNDAVSQLSGNDNDEISRRQLTVDGKTTLIGDGPNQHTLLSANTWHTVEVIYFNTNSANVDHLTLYDWSKLNVFNDNNHAVTFKVKDFRYAVDDQKYL